MAERPDIVSAPWGDECFVVMTKRQDGQAPSLTKACSADWTSRAQAASLFHDVESARQLRDRMNNDYAPAKFAVFRVIVCNPTEVA